jgi:DNA helicase-2/ATP-dependent DNA helicase PcrA
VKISEALLKAYPRMNDAQRAIVGHGEGPLLVIAGPGSGKTFSLVLRVMNLLLFGKAKPKEVIVCTFTEKAAFELRDRIASAARQVGFKGDLSELRVSTIHGLCNKFLMEHRHRTRLGNNYDTLDDLTQLLFIFEHFKTILSPELNPPYLNKWSTKWTAIKGARAYFNKITEELVDHKKLKQASDPFIERIVTAYAAYQKALI